jgi:hypothetical protein
MLWVTAEAGLQYKLGAFLQPRVPSERPKGHMLAMSPQPWDLHAEFSTLEDQCAELQTCKAGRSLRTRF